MMKAYLAIWAILLIAVSARSGETDRKPLDEQFLRNYMAGEYDLIGRKADSSATYNGHVTLRDEGGVLQVTRTVEGKTDKCAARFDTVAGTDRIPVLRIHFILTARSMTPPTAGNLILTITHDLPATFIFPAPNRLASKRFSQSINDKCEKLLSIFKSKFSMLNRG
jgi:hypothetical protein